MIKVLIVEDSPSAASLISYILSSDPAIEVIGTAISGEEAIRMTDKLNPEVISMDINLPGIDGFEATRRIMETQPVPIVIVSSVYNTKEMATSFKAIEAGAMAILGKPPGIGHPDFNKSAQELIWTVKAMSEIKAMKRRQKKESPVCKAPETGTARHEIRLIAIGASTGGPPALQTILSKLPKDIGVPVLVVQHIARGFAHGFSEWLSQTTGFPAHVADNNETPLPGHLYIAPSNFHMIIQNEKIRLTNDPPESGLRPAVSHLFRSVAMTLRHKAAGVLLTGMGRDGAEELKLMKDNGAVTIAQDSETSVVHGMPGEAIRIGGATYVLPDYQIAEVLTGLVKRKGL
ncbi:MAG: chemotaxis-specific protein-glutamate methyltransferase CheB [Nitrospirae bacterium]|nr:chemotaxis-specific protein-glutamate methyltransferase CheB [Nitrospirota bacterium]